MVVCPKCGADWRRVYPNEEIDNLEDMAQYNLARTVQCVNKECSYVWQLSPIEIITHYFKIRKAQGVSVQDAAKELREKHEKDKQEGRFEK